MRTLFAFTFGVIATLLGVTHILPSQTNVNVTEAVTETVYINQVVTTLDLEQLRDTTTADPNLNDQLNHECAYAIQRQTDEPLHGIIHYNERWWSGDSCAAYEHLQTHAWY